MATNEPNLSTCSPWATTADVTVVETAGLDTDQTAVLDSCLQAASDVLYKLTGAKYGGLCRETVRPLIRATQTDHGRPIRQQMIVGFGAGYWSGGYSGTGDFSLYGWALANQVELPGGFVIPAIDLPNYPVVAVHEVKIDGNVITPSSYRVDDHRSLTRLVEGKDGGYVDLNPNGWTEAYPANSINYGWPTVQNMDLPDTAPGTWSVDYSYGVAPPILGKLAAAELAGQLFLAVNPDPKGPQSRLPSRVTRITRQGVDAVVLDPQVFLDRGRTGLYLCDLFIEAENPNKLQRRSSVMTPDIDRRARRTGPVGTGS